MNFHRIRFMAEPRFYGALFIVANIFGGAILNMLVSKQIRLFNGEKSPFPRRLFCFYFSCYYFIDYMGL